MATTQQRTSSKPIPPASTATPPTVQGTPVDTTETVADIRAALGHCTVVHGDIVKPFDVAGETVAAVRESLADAFSIPPDAKAYIDGNEVNGDTVIQGGVTLEFIKESGQKG